MEKRETVKRQQQAITATHELLRHVSRLFHDPKHTVCLDYIIRMRCIADDALAERLHCQLKDVHRLLAVLRDDKMIKVESRQENSTGSSSSGSSGTSSSSGGQAANSKMGTTRMYSYVDLRQAVRAIRWRLEKMREASEARLRADLERKGYKCGQCGRKWSPLDVHSLTVTVDGFQCDNCDLTVLTDDDEEDGDSTVKILKKRPQELHVQLMDTVGPLVMLLKRINLDDLPTIRFNDLMKSIKHPNTANQDSDDQKLLKTPAALEIGVTVELDSDTSPDSTAKHDLPVWYTHSTVTGEKLVDKHDLDADHDHDHDNDGEPQHGEPTAKKSRSVEIVFGDFDDIPSPHHTPPDADPMITVRGTEKSFSQVTEEDKRMMTSEEYERYFEHYLRIQGQE